MHNYDWWATLLASMFCSIGEVSCGPEQSSSRSTRNRRPSAGLKPGDLVTELDGTPVRDAADLQLRLALLKDRRSRRIRHVAPRRRGDGARREEREPAARSK